MANEKTFDQIVNEIFNRLTNVGITDFNPGSIARSLIEAFALGLAEAWYALSSVPDKYFLDKASGEYLDRRAAEHGIQRKQGSFAAGSITLIRSTPAPFSQLIPAGTQFEAEGGLLYSTVSDATLAKGSTSVTVEVKAAAEGAANNLPCGTSLRQVGVAISLIETAQVAEAGIAGGADQESDEELRRRLLIEIRNQDRGGTVADYERWAKSVPKVADVKCLPCVRGPGTVDVLIMAAEGAPSADLLAAVQAVVEQKRPIGADVRVIAPIARTINVTANLTPAPGYSSASLVDAVTAAIRNYITGVPMGGVVRLSGIGNAIHDCPGVEDYVLVEPQENIELDQTEMPVPVITIV